MKEYNSKEDLLAEIQKAAALFLQEFDEIPESDKDLRLEEVDRTPQEMLAYQLGWMELLRGWDRDELSGAQVVTPAPGYKWNQMGGLYQTFYEQHSSDSLAELKQKFTGAVADLNLWIQNFSDMELFEQGGRKWAQSTPSNWPVWKWVHINTVAPFQSFRSKIRKWKKLRAQQ